LVTSKTKNVSSTAISIVPCSTKSSSAQVKQRFDSQQSPSKPIADELLSIFAKLPADVLEIVKEYPGKFSATVAYQIKSLQRDAAYERP
jgi:hypothetical protein